MENRLVIAAAGSGKTRFLIDEALKVTDGRVLMTTYTQANEAEIRNRIIQRCGSIPNHITVQTWFSFLMQHGVKPYQGSLYQGRVKGLILVNTKSGFKGFYKGKPIYFGEKNDFEKHYFTRSKKIYSDKISKFVFRCNEVTNGEVINRLSRIFKYIFVDEVQDLAGYDLELLKLIFESNSTSLLVGDPRQGTYSTNTAAKNKQYRKAKIVYFFDVPKLPIEINETLLTTNYRSNETICKLSNELFPEHSPTDSGNDVVTGHDGVFFVKKDDVDDYLNKFNPMQLRDKKTTKGVREGHLVMNFGESKGLSFDRVLIYPTQPFLNWLKNKQNQLAPTSRAKFYVALTRAKYSVGIVTDNDCSSIAGIKRYERV